MFGSDRAVYSTSRLSQDVGIAVGGDCMRHLLSLVATLVVAVGIAPSAPSAQSVDEFGIPAEFPPASYTGRQYVDSRGCVYIRAGIDGSTTWVPRVTRDRSVICGAEPTLTPTTSPAPAAPVRTAPAASGTAIAGTAAAQPMSRTHVAHTKRPQANPPVVRDSRTLRVATRETVGPNTYIAPRHVVESQLAARDGVHVPKGYEPVWEDDRLSLTRAHQTYSGQDQSAQFWDRDVPRNLVPRRESGTVTVSSQGATRTGAPTLSTRSAAAAPSHRYVEAGVFRTESKAREAARLMTQAGLPAAISPRRSGGVTYTAALAGPFATQAQLDAAFARLRTAYPGATLRK